MEERVSVGLTRREETPTEEGRKFGFAVGAAFLGLAAVGFIRTRTNLFVVIFLAFGIALTFTALLAPSRLAPVSRVWMRMALALSRVTTPILMSAVFFSVITPVGLVMRWTGHRPLQREPLEGGFWVKKDSSSGTRSQLERQF